MNLIKDYLSEESLGLYYEDKEYAISRDNSLRDALTMLNILEKIKEV